MVIPADGYELMPSFQSTRETGPRHFILGWTRERIYLPHTSRLCARVEGKSSSSAAWVWESISQPPPFTPVLVTTKMTPRITAHRCGWRSWNVGPLPVMLVKDMRICQLIIEEVREVPKAGYGGDFNLQGPSPRTA